MELMMKCKRCNGEGQTDVDRAPPVSPEMCHRCDGSGKEPEGTFAEQIDRYRQAALDRYLAAASDDGTAEAFWDEMVLMGMMRPRV